MRAIEVTRVKPSKKKACAILMPYKHTETLLIDVQMIV